MPDIIKKEANPAEIIKQPEQVLEQPVGLEVSKELGPEIPEITKRPSAVGQAQEKSVVGSGQAAPVAGVKSETFAKIEDILEEDLEDIYFSLPPQKQAEFQKKGEETSSKIELLLSGVKISIGKILALIINWLKIIPGINKFFLEQEAKIKANKIFDLKKESDLQDKNKI